MAQNRKGIRTSRTREDYELFKISYPFYDPLDVQDIFLHVEPGTIATPTTVLATVHFRQKELENKTFQMPNDFELKTHLSGTIEKVGDNFVQTESSQKNKFHLKNGISKGNLELCMFRQCDHTPQQQSFLSGNIIRQSTQKNSLPTYFHNVCGRCQKALWIYYEEEEISITLEQLLQLNNNNTLRNKIHELEWAIILNEQFTPTVGIAKIKDEELTIPYLAKATFLLNVQECPQKKLREGTIIMKIRKAICKHEKLIEGRCQYCMEQIRQEHVRKYETYLFQLDQTTNGGMLVKGTALAKQQEQFIQHLMENQKTIMILDLDNTILHSNEMSELQVETVMGLEDYYLIPKIQPYSPERIRKDYIVVKMRPYFKYFLYEVSKNYQIYVYTKGTRLYAEEICNFIRAQYAGERNYHVKTWNQQFSFLKSSKNFKPHRIISRNEDGNLQTKSMQKILPSKKDYHIILDDRRDVWNNSPSWYFTQEYYYFAKELRVTAKNPVKPIDQISHFMSSEKVDMPQVKNALFEQLKIIKQYYPEKNNVYVSVINKPDYFLLFAAHALTKINRNFFDFRKKAKGQQPTEQKHDKNQTVWYLQHRLKHFFSKHKIRFFGVANDSTGTIRRAQKLGMVVLTKQNQDSATLAIRSRNFLQLMKKAESPPETTLILNQQYNYAQELQTMKKMNEKKIPIVSEAWIQNCYELNYPFSYQKYIVANPFEDDAQNSTAVKTLIENVALHIKRDIEAKMEKEFTKSE